MARSSLYREGMDSRELDEKWIEVYEKDMEGAESFYSVQKIKYIFVGIVIGLSINIVDRVSKKERGLNLNEGYVEENKTVNSEDKRTSENSIV